MHHLNFEIPYISFPLFDCYNKIDITNGKREEDEKKNQKENR